MTTPRQNEAIAAYKRLGSYSAVARELGVTRQTATDLIKRGGVEGKGVTAKPRYAQRPTEPVEKIETAETEDGFFVEVQSLERIQTAEQALKKAGIDTAIWKPVKVVANSWEVAIKQEDGSALTVPLWQVKVTCERRIPEAIESSVDVLAERMFKGKFAWPKVNHRPKRDPETMVVGLVDHHFGKLAWEPETGNDYDLKIATSLYSRAIDAAANAASGRAIEKVILPIGNDFGHIDTRAGTTEAGTPQDRDGRYEKIAGILEMATMNAVRVAREIAPVQVLWVGGNHDPVTSMWLCRCVHHAFSGDKWVTVDTHPRPVKYVHFGRCLLGFAHGDAPREKALKDLMPIERADEWAASKACREWLTGHLHQSKKTERIGTHEEAGMIFRILPSLCGTDSWHYRHGFSMSRKATETHFYSHRWGHSGFVSESAEKLLAV